MNRASLSPAADNHAAARQMPAPPDRRFITLMGLTMAMVALTIDVMLPAVPVIGAAMGAGGDSPLPASLIITVVFIGMGLGNLIYGPLSDAFGRKPLIQIGFAVLILGSLLSIVAHDMETMLIARFIQGLGAAGPRVLVTAIIRDLYVGREMARASSLVMSIFILVPILAPALGQGLIWLGSWHWCFGLLIMQSLILMAWVHYGLAETHPPARRQPFHPRAIKTGLLAVFSYRQSVGYLLTSAMVYAILVAYLGVAAEFWGEIYGYGAWFPVVFGFLALFVGAAGMLNARLVMRLGMRKLTHGALRVVIGLGAVITGFILLTGQIVPAWAMLPLMGAMFFALGVTFGNLNALAMEPLGHHAGAASAVISSLTSLISALVGSLIAAAFTPSTLALAVGVLGCSLIALLTASWASRGMPAR